VFDITDARCNHEVQLSSFVYINNAHLRYLRISLRCRQRFKFSGALSYRSWVSIWHSFTEDLNLHASDWSQKNTHLPFQLETFEHSFFLLQRNLVFFCCKGILEMGQKHRWCINVHCLSMYIFFKYQIIFIVSNEKGNLCWLVCR
jgi:hypothetical protein